MTDTKPQKPTWIRHKPGCGQRIFNDDIDISAHKRYCPADHDKRLGQIDRALAAALARLDELEAAATAPAPEPVLNDDVADWNDEYEQVSQYADGEKTDPNDGEPNEPGEPGEPGPDSPYFTAIDRDDTYTR